MSSGEDFYDEDFCYGDAGDCYAYVAVHPSSSVMGTERPGRGDKAQVRTIEMEQVWKLKENCVQATVSITCLSTSAASLLLEKYGWSCQRAEEAYFEDSSAALKALDIDLAGACKDSVLIRDPSMEQKTCGMCYGEYASNDMLGLSSCNHFFCAECWEDHIRVRLDMDLLNTRCPAQGCSQIVGLSVMNQVFEHSRLSEAEKTEMMQNIKLKLLHSFVNANPSLYWCPNPRSCRGVFSTAVPPLEGEAVRCEKCSNEYCIRCGLEPHQPCSCSHAQDWKETMFKEGANAKYIQTHAKHCPKCKKPIEKNGGCLHMTCRCGHEFCWICLGSWDSHSGNTWQCGSPPKSEDDQLPELKEAARYLYHLERFTANKDSAVNEEKLIAQLTKLDMQKGVRLAETTNTKNPIATETLTATLLSGSAFPNDTIDGEKTNNLVEVLKRARYAIANTYVELYYLHDAPEIELLRLRLGKLQEATEKASSMISRYFRRQLKEGDMMDMIGEVMRWTRSVCDP